MGIVVWQYAIFNSQYFEVFGHRFNFLIQSIHTLQYQKFEAFRNKLLVMKSHRKVSDFNCVAFERKKKSCTKVTSIFTCLKSNQNEESLIQQNQY